MFNSSEVVKRPLKLFAAFYTLAVLFGAPLASDFQATAFLALILSLCTGLPLLLVYKNDSQLSDLFFRSGCTSPSEYLALGACYGSLVGCYVGGFVIPLDWDRPWQKYSFPNCVGTVAGEEQETMEVATMSHSEINISTSFPSSPTPTITPSSSSGSISSHEGQFGKYRLGERPPLEAMFFAVFDNKSGPVVKYLEVANHVNKKAELETQLKERFNSISGSIITKQELLNRLVKINFSDIKISGFPTCLTNNSYERGKLTFNMCFVVAKTSNIDCMYEPLVQKLAEYLVELEQQRRFISTPETAQLLPGIMRDILKQLNDFGECVYPVRDVQREILTTIYLILCPSYRGVEPPKVAPYMVPMLTRKVDVSANSALVQKMDVLSQKIIPKIDGIRCVKEIAAEVSIDADLVARCVRNLYFYECVTLLPLFLYQNCYVSTEKLHDFYENKERIEECQQFVKIRYGDSRQEVLPKFSDIFRLYMNLTCGFTMKRWCEVWNPKRYHVDERRLIQYGMYHKFLRKLSIFPVTKVSPDNKEEFTRIHSLCANGINAIEDLAVLYSVPPDQLLDYLHMSGKFEFISK